MMRPLSILMVTCQFMPEVFGGAEQQCLRQAAALARRGHAVTILTSRNRASTAPKEVIEGVEVVRYRTFWAPDLLGRYAAFSLLWILQTLGFALRTRGRFDVVHCHQGKFGIFIGAMISAVQGVPQVVKIGNSAPFMDLAALRRKVFFGPLFLKMALWNRPTFVAISGMISRDLKQFGIAEKQVVKIVNGVMPLQPKFRAAHGKRVRFFWHGRFEGIKNLGAMLEGFALACAAHKDIDLHLVGNGREEAALLALADRLDLGTRVEFVAPPKDIPALIGTYDVFINTSLAEGMSNAMLEAMALGKVMVSTPVSGSDEIIDEGRNGYVFADGSARAVADGIEQARALWLKDAKGVHAYNLKKTAKVFASEVIAQQYEALYARLTER